MWGNACNICTLFNFNQIRSPTRLNKYLHRRTRGNSLEKIDKKMKLWIAARQDQIAEVLALWKTETQLMSSTGAVNEAYNEDDAWCQFSIGDIFPKWMKTRAIKEIKPELPLLMAVVFLPGV